MKIGDVEFQGDGTKAIFYYIADERVDFRELIKIMAEEFKIRIEMKQIGARQEAGRIGGIGHCGRELCCTTWITNFVSVSTNSARHQELSLNPQKLAGQCGKLKCCLNYELDAYIDAQKDFPNVRQPLETMDGTAYHQKTDIFKRVMWYSYDQNSSANITVVPIERVKEIIEMNKAGKKPDTLLINDKNSEQEQPQSAKETTDDFTDGGGTDSITRFDKKKKKKKKKNNQNGQNNPNGQNGQNNQNGQNKQPQQQNNSQPQPKKQKQKNNNRPPQNGNEHQQQNENNKQN
jgi:cell fate regulator YaaT (PSP1 superfamily)